MPRQLTAAAMAAQLDRQTIYWRNLTIDQRRSVVRHIIADMTERHGTVTRAVYDAEKPDWAPLAQWLGRAVGMSLRTLTQDTRRHGIYCECGRRYTHIVPVTLLSPQGAEITEKLYLCDACHAEFMALEAHHA